MDPYPHPSYTSSFLSTSSDSNHHHPPAMRGAKRKRLAKACDACHKSKRRCDGTAPCSNCFFASKQCTYTDASGRPVPAPHRQAPPSDSRAPAFSVPPPPPSSEPSRFPHPPRPSYSSPAPPQPLPVDSNDDDRKNYHRKRFRTERGDAIPPEDLIIDGPVTSISMDRPAPVDLDHGLTRELTNLFFTHCHPARSIIHKPTFTVNLSHNRVPSYLLHAVCALAAPLSKQPRIRTSPARFAGKPFAQEALSLMFDGAGRLVCEPNLAAAQALCLLQMHDIVTKESNVVWGSRYHDLAYRIVEALGVHSPEHPTLTPVPSPEFISASLEREAIRRIFWYIHLIDVKASIYFKKPITFTAAELRLRLPVDETSFELGVHSTLPEYLHLPAVRTQYASEFGHLIRIITIYAKVELIIDDLNVPFQGHDSLTNTSKALLEAEQHMEDWARTLPDHLRFSEQSLDVQQSMFETSSNTGAWCWCALHIYHATCAIAIDWARQRNPRDSVTEPQWAINMIDSILKMLGDRAKNSLLLGTALWSFIKYCKRDDPQLRAWCADYEETSGTKMVELVQDWRPQPSPPQRHQFTQLAQPSHSQQQRPQPRFSRTPPLNLSGRPPPLQHGGDVSRHILQSPTSPVNPYSRGRYTDDPSQSNAASSPSRLHGHLDNRTASHLPPPGSSSSSSASRSLGSYSSGDTNYSPIKTEKESPTLLREANFDNAAAQASGTAAQSSSSTSGGSSPNGSAPNSATPSSRNSVVGEATLVHSLPSLKASGLLDWNTGGTTSGSSRLSELQKQSHGSPAGAAPPRRSPPMHHHPLYQNPPPDERRSAAAAATTLGMPAGLPWLANETR